MSRLRLSFSAATLNEGLNESRTIIDELQRLYHARPGGRV
jgi:hypothetical protein